MFRATIPSRHSTKAPAVVHQDVGLLFGMIRDIFKDDVDELVAHVLGKLESKPEQGFADAEATGTVIVQVKNDVVPSPNLLLTNLGNGTYSLRFDGIPGLTYRIEYTDGLAPPDWQAMRQSRSS